MPTRSASAEWNGSLLEGKGTLKTQTGVLSAPYDWKSRAGEGTNTNPEELLGAAHAGCFSMAFAHALTQAGFTPTKITTTAKVTIEQVADGFAIPRIALATTAVVPKIDEATFKKLADGAKAGCPVSKALTGVEISLDAKLTK